MLYFVLQDEVVVGDGRRGNSLVPHEEVVVGGGEEEQVGEVHEGGGGDGGQRADGDAFLGVREVTGPVAARHDAWDGGEWFVLSFVALDTVFI